MVLNINFNFHFNIIVNVKIVNYIVLEKIKKPNLKFYLIGISNGKIVY